MLTHSINIQIPPVLLQFGIDQEEIQRRVIEWLVLSLFVENRISSGKAAKLLNMSRVNFFAFLRKHGIAYINYSSEDLAEEFEAVQMLTVDSQCS